MITINGCKLEPTIFPDKTSQVWKLSGVVLGGNFAHVVWEFESEAELIHLAQLKDLLDSYELSACLRLPYLPYARQDKLITNDSTFALRTFAKILNGLHFDEVIISDPHSEAALRLIHNSKAEYPKIDLIFQLTQSNLLCYPDKGALEKYKKLYGQDFIYGEKVRDQSTGNILSYNLVGNVNGQSVLIVDDICDGGATFVHLAQSLIEKGATEVNLFVSHGLFTKGLQVLKDAGINRIFTKTGEIK